MALLNQQTINWLSKLPVFKEIYRQGGIDAFPLAHKDILETMRDDLDAKAEELALKKFNDLLVPVDLNAVVSMDKRVGAVYVNGNRIEEGRLAALKSEAEAITNLDVWKLIYETPKELAHKAMFSDDGKLENQLMKGRAMLYLLDTQKRILDIFKSYSPK